MQRDVILCIDQSGSMAASVVYSSVFAAVLASLRSLRTSLVVFDTAVVDLTAELHDPVEVLFGTQLGGGTDINQALAYCQGLVVQPDDTILVLISDLYEGGDQAELLRRAAALVASGVTLVALLALSDDGAPRLRPRERAGARRARRARLRLHAGPVPRSDGGRHRAPRPRRLGGGRGHRRGARPDPGAVMTIPRNGVMRPPRCEPAAPRNRHAPRAG